MNIVVEKGLEVLRSVGPIFLFGLAIHFFLIPFETATLWAFVLGTVLIVIGLALFLTGVDTAITPIGEELGKGMAKSNTLKFLIPTGLLLGFVISVAEPSLLVLGNQIQLVTNGAMSSLQLVVTVSIGLAVMVALGLVRMVYQWSFIKLIAISYILIFTLSLFSSSEFISIAFDASGATTGVITVPFLLSLSMGISTLKKSSKKSSDDSFGLVALASSGAIIAVLLANIFIATDTLTGDLTLSFGFAESFLQTFIQITGQQVGDALLSILPIALIFILFNFMYLKLKRRPLRRIVLGLVYNILGLILFLAGVNFGFMNVGTFIGYELTQFDSLGWFYVLSFILGMVTIVAEPAVNVLANQVRTVTAGALKPGFVYAALALGVGFATLFASLRVAIPGLELWHFLLPGYLIAFGLSKFVDPTIVAMAFDAGGVASGPMTGTFILAFIQGAAQSVDHASVMIDGFGMIALVAMMPIITIQLFGFAYSQKEE